MAGLDLKQSHAHCQVRECRALELTLWERPLGTHIPATPQSRNRNRKKLRKASKGHQVYVNNAMPATEEYVKVLGTREKGIRG